ncbi:MAG TPA: hypothetical protein VJ781_03955 [Pyrinomonadaceae bacterium]|nr:hypothetical protein [Pyrinomonadaceae bacterium]
MFAYTGWIRKHACGPALAFGICPLFFYSHAQSQPTINDIVLRSSRETKRYSEEFKNLVAKETKTIRTFDKSDRLKRERVIVSNFLVYQFLNGNGEITEFRSVLSVDGKLVSDPEKRAVELFERVSKAESSAGELTRIQKESLRYDAEIQIVGLTLFQGIALDERVRDSFIFEFEDRELVGSSDTYVLRYRQIKDSDMIRLSNRTGIPAVLEYDLDLGDLKNTSPRLNGTLWIDRNNFQILREVRELVIRWDEFERPTLIAANEFEYSPGEFAIHTPRRIVHTQFRADPKTRRTTKEIEYQFVYSNFVRPKVDVSSDKPSDRP